MKEKFISPLHVASGGKDYWFEMRISPKVVQLEFWESGLKRPKIIKMKKKEGLKFADAIILFMRTITKTDWEKLNKTGHVRRKR